MDRETRELFNALVTEMDRRFDRMEAKDDEKFERLNKKIDWVYENLSHENNAYKLEHDVLMMLVNKMYVHFKKFLTFKSNRG